MRNRKAQGFTLIELLIVIAIIGILAAVLIPNLMNARVSAAQRAAQAHSSNVYTAFVAALADAPASDSATILGSLTNCAAAQTVGNYSHNAAPGGVVDCTVAAVGTSDFTVTVNYGSGGSAKRYVNGREVAITGS